MTAPAYDSLPKIGTIGRFDVVGRIAVGGMAEIFLARDGNGQLVALKRVLSHVAAKSGYADGVRHEAQILVHLRHPNLCAVHELGHDDESFFLALEFVHGVSLRQLGERMASRGGLPVHLAVRIAADVAEALHHAHVAADERGEPLAIVHRDVTPENVLVGFDGTVKLLDFGIAKARDQGVQTQQGELKGKFAYMSPEQYQGELVDGRSDVFSLGVCLYEAMTGRPLFERATEYQTIAAVVLDEPPAPPSSLRAGIPPALDEAVARALAKKRDERHATAAALGRALARAVPASQGDHAKRELAALVRSAFPKEAVEGPKLDRSPLWRNVREDRLDGPRDLASRAALAAELDAEQRRIELDASARRRNVALGVAVLVAAGLLMSFCGTCGAPDDPPAVLAP